MTPEMIAATRALLKARDEHVVAQLAEQETRRAYAEAEEAYLNAVGDRVPNVLAGKVLVLPRDDWYDLKKGERLEYRTVQEVEVTP